MAAETSADATNRPSGHDDAKEITMPLGARQPRPSAPTPDAGPPPLCDEETFASILAGMVADEAPRVFAIVAEYGERADGCITAWGMEFDNHAEVVSVEGGVSMSTRSAESALRGFSFDAHTRPRVVWVDPSAATAVEPG